MTAGELLDELTPERVWSEIRKALEGENPRLFFETLRSCDAQKPLIPELDALFGVSQPAKPHPEIDTGVHIMMALEQAELLCSVPKELVSIDFFTVPTATFRILYVLFVLRHVRRQVVHFNVTEHPTAQWTAKQMVEAFPFDTAPQYLLRDRDSIYGERFRRRVKSLGIEEVRIAPISMSCFACPLAAPG